MSAERKPLLIHGYMFPLEGERPRLGLRNHMQASAAVHLYENGKVGPLVIPGGHWWGEEKPSFAELMSNELQRRGVNKEDIIADPKTKTTSEEADVFLAKGQKEKWGSTASLANSRHMRRVTRTFKGRDQNVELLKTEDVLAQVVIAPEGTERFPYRKFLNKFKYSKDEFVFGAREWIVNQLYSLGLEKKLVQLSQNTTVNKIKSFFDK